MAHMAQFTSMMKTPEKVKEERGLPAAAPEMAQPIYPYGLCISLGNDEIEKLGLDAAGCEVGAVVHLCCLAKVTSCSKSATDQGENHRIEMQITDIACDDEEDQDAATEARRGRFYNKVDAGSAEG
jgi:hypothetical protein